MAVRAVNMKARTILKTLVTLGLLGLLASQIDLAVLYQVLGDTRLVLLVPAILLQLLLISFGVLRWHTIVGNFELDIGLLQLGKLAFIGNFFNLFLPSSIGGDFFRAYYLAKDQRRGMSTTLTTTLLERSGGLCALLMIGLAASSTQNLRIREVSIFQIFVLLSTAYVMVNLALFNPRSHRFLDHLWEWLHLNQFQQKMKLVYSGLETLIANRKAIVRLISLSLVIQFFSVVIVWILSRALGIAAPFHIFFIFVPLINLSIMVPLTINGFGLREGLYLLFFTQIGLDQERAVALSLLAAVVIMAAALPGGVIYSFYKRKEKFSDPTRQEIGCGYNKASKPHRRGGGTWDDSQD